jgi:dihydroflavonol-4-reductase
MPAVSSGDGPVVVTGASGYIGSHVVHALVSRGFEVRACITDPSNPQKTEHLLAMNDAPHEGSITLHRANLLEEGSYDEPVAGCSAVLHVGTAMGYAGANKPQQVYDTAVNGARNLLGSVRKAGTVRRLVYTSSFSAISHPAPPGYVFTEDDWASDNRENDPGWSLDDLDDKGETGYAMSKVETEHMVVRAAEEDGRFESISICPLVVLGPLLTKAHELVYSWQWFLGRMLRGKDCQRGWQHLWNIVDVRDVAAAHALAILSDVCRNGDRYQLAAADASGEIDCMQLQAHLQKLFPHVDVGGAPEALKPMLEKHGRVYDAPRARSDKARRDLGLETHAVEDTLRETAQTMIDLGLVEPKLR